MLVRLSALLLWLALGLSGAVFSFSSDFEGGSTEGWSIFTPIQNYVGGTGPVALLTGGVGNSGYLQAEDTANGFLYFIAPSDWSGDLWGGQFSFYLRNQNPNVLANAAGQPAVRIVSSNGTALYYLNLPGATNDWTLNQLTLTQSPNWRLGTGLGSAVPDPSLVSQVLTNVVEIGILADWVSRYEGHPLGGFGPDITGLDRVSLTSSIPEPATALTLLGGLAALVLYRRRR